MKIMSQTDDILIVDCPRMGTVFLLLFTTIPGIVSIALLTSTNEASGIFGGLFFLLFVAFGIAGLWDAARVELILDRTTELATIKRHLPHKLQVETYLLREIDDVTNARSDDGTGYGLLLELVGGKVVRLTSANHYNPEAQTVGKKIRDWLKVNGYR